MYRSSGVISWVSHDENGWVPAAAMTRPLLPASSITVPRRRTSSARASAGVLADSSADLDHRLVQLRLDLAQQEMIAVENLGDVRLQLPGFGIDDLVLFLDPEGQ